MPTNIITAGGAGPAGGGSPGYNPEAYYGTKSAFGDIKAVEPTLVALATFPYGPLEGVAISGLYGSASISTVSGMAKISSGASANSSGTLRTFNHLQYIPGLGAMCRITAKFDTPVAGNIQAVGVGDTYDGFFIGYSGLNFGVCKIRDTVQEWVFQEDWSRSPTDMNWQKLNVFEIQYQWLGAGAIKFKTENPTNGLIETVHQWDYTNLNEVPSVLNPTFPVAAYNLNYDNTTNKDLHIVCLAGFIEGTPPKVGKILSVSNEKAGITTETNVLTVRNKTAFKNYINRTQGIVLNLSAASDGTKPVVINVYFNATLGGSPSYSGVHNDSCMEYDIAGTTVSGGSKVLSFTLGRTDSKFIQFVQQRVAIPPGIAVTVSAQSSNSADVDVSTTWREEY